MFGIEPAGGFDFRKLFQRGNVDAELLLQEVDLISLRIDRVNPVHFWRQLHDVGGDVDIPFEIGRSEFQQGGHIVDLEGQAQRAVIA